MHTKTAKHLGKDNFSSKSIAILWLFIALVATLWPVHSHAVLSHGRKIHRQQLERYFLQMFARLSTSKNCFEKSVFAEDLFLDGFNLGLRSRFGFKVPGAVGLSIIPETEISWIRRPPNQDYSNAALPLRQSTQKEEIRASHLPSGNPRTSSRPS